jgi:hypothetical protein
VLAVNLEEPRDKVATWVRSRQLTMRVPLDIAGEVSTVWRVSHTPMIFLLARNGELVAGGIGNRPWTGPAGRALLDALVAP